MAAVEPTTAAYGGVDDTSTQITTILFDKMDESVSRYGAFQVDKNGRFGNVKSSKEDVRVVKKTLLLSNSAGDTKKPDPTGNKEAMILAHAKTVANNRKYMPLLIDVTFLKGMVLSIKMSNEGCDLETLRYVHCIVPCVTLLTSNICEAVVYLNKIGIVHNNITPRNVTYNRTEHRFKLVAFDSAEFAKLGATELGIAVDTKKGHRAIGKVRAGSFAWKYVPEGTLVCLSDVRPMYSCVRSRSKLSKVPYRDISHVMSDRPSKMLNRFSDVFGATMTVATTLSEDNRSVSSLPQLEYYDVNCERGREREGGDNDKIEDLVKICRHLVDTRGPTSDVELSFWRNYINPNSALSRALQRPPKTKAFLDKFENILGAQFVGALKQCLSPMPEHRRFRDLCKVVGQKGNSQPKPRKVDLKKLSVKRVSEKTVYLSYDAEIIVGGIKFGNESENGNVVVVEHVFSMIDDRHVYASFAMTAIRLCQYIKARIMDIPLYNEDERRRLSEVFGSSATRTPDGKRMLVTVDDDAQLLSSIKAYKKKTATKSRSKTDGLLGETVPGGEPKRAHLQSPLAEEKS